MLQVLKWLSRRRRSPSPAIVTVKAATSIVNQVDKVVANVAIPEGTKTDYTTTAQLQALDATGKPVAVKIDPRTRTGFACQFHRVKDCSLNDNRIFIELFIFNSTTKQVTILGAQSSPGPSKAIPVLVDVSNITQSTTKTITLTLPSGSA